MKQSKVTVSIVSLGCSKNQVDSEIMSASLLREGFSFVSDPSEAEVILLNSCSFIREAVKESLTFLDALGQYKDQGTCRCLVLTGCLVERYGKELRRQLPYVDLFVGMRAEPEVGAILKRHLRDASSRSFFLRAPPNPGVKKRSSWQGRQALGVWAYVKIAEGCSNRCAYCTIPDIRGPLRSRKPEDIQGEVAHLAHEGVKEINLVAQDVAGYGREWKPRRKAPLPDLLRRLNRIEGIRWIRLLYCHPAHVDEALVGALGDLEKVCPYLDLPVQHVSKPVLHAMNRPYDIRRLRSLIRSLRKTRPDIALRTTLMVGFPGEKEKDVEQLLRFLEEIRFHHLGVFCYSPEPGTEAHERKETVPQKEKESRFQAVMDLQADISASIQQSYVGTLQTALVEGEHEEDPHMLQARTPYQAPEVDGMVVIPKDQPAGPGLATVRITGASTYDLYGEICEEGGS
jgi:ribosomal protein S12 methylthiotransferase